VAGTCKYSDELSGSGATELPYLRKLCKEFLEGVVLGVTLRLGPELGILFINLK
jgi:hypothetical protein